jgi:hypothetical protein
MRWSQIIGVVAATLLGLSMSAAPSVADPAPGVAAAANDAKPDLWAQVKSLAGKWTVPASDEHKTPEMEVEFRVTSAGGSMVETMFAGTPMEMVNVYTRDGDAVVVTHYCAAGNAPRMKLTAIQDGKMKFEFLDGTNIAPGAMFMGKLEMHVAGDTLTQHWTSLKDGKEAQHVTIEMKRAKTVGSP